MIFKKNPVEMSNDQLLHLGHSLNTMHEGHRARKKKDLRYQKVSLNQPETKLNPIFDQFLKSVNDEISKRGL